MEELYKLLRDETNIISLESVIINAQIESLSSSIPIFLTENLRSFVVQLNVSVSHIFMAFGGLLLIDCIGNVCVQTVFVFLISNFLCCNLYDKT